MSEYSYRTQSGQYPESSMASAFCAFPDIIYSMCQATVFSYCLPRKSRERAALLILVYAYWNLFTCFPDHVFLNLAFPGSLLSLLHWRIKVH